MKALSKVLWVVDLNRKYSTSMDRILDSKELFGPEIILLHVLPGEIQGSSFQETVEMEIRSELDQISRDLDENENFGVKIRIAFGEVPVEVLEVAKDEAVSFIFYDQRSRLN